MNPRARASAGVHRPFDRQRQCVQVRNHRRLVVDRDVAEHALRRGAFLFDEIGRGHVFQPGQPVDDDADVRDALAQTITLNDLTARPVSSFIEAKDMIAADFDGVVLSDIRMPGRDGFFLLDHSRRIDPDLPVEMVIHEDPDGFKLPVFKLAGGA